MASGAGDDIYLVNSTSDVVTEAVDAGTDTVQSSISYALPTNIENLVLTGTGDINGTGNDLANTINGNAGNNTIDGGAGADNMAGDAGNDIYVVDNAGDVVTEASGAGTDTVRSSISYALPANVENLILIGTGNINGTGNGINNLLTGNSAANILSGGAGDDTYLVNNTSDVVSEAASEGIDTVQSSVSYTLATNVEKLVLISTGNINGTGNDLANTINGNAGNNNIDGGTGADSLAGGAGDDTYLLDNASDVVTEAIGAGTDTVQSSFSYALTANVENLILTGTGNINGAGNALNNILTGNSAANILSGGAGDDTYFIDNASDIVLEAASEGNDTVQSSISYALTANVENLTLTGTGNINATGNDLVNTINGNTGDNIIDGGTGADSLGGGAGDDTYLVDNTSDVVSEDASEGTDTVQSSATYSLTTNVENLVLTGTGNINATGNDLANTITGNAGNNNIDGGTGADSLAGGAGDDTYLLDNASDVVTEAVGAGTDTVQSSISYALTANVENLILTGTGNINGTGNDLANTITGNAGNNTIDGATGEDNLAGDAGNDIYVVDNAGDVVSEASAAGTDTVQSSISYTLTANVENLVLTGTSNINGTGNALNNRLTGNSAANILSGGVGADTMAGGAGDDIYIVDNAGDVISETASEGTDTVQSSVTYSLARNVENLILTGTSNINGTGNALNNILTGNSAANILSGDAGADNMEGGAGDDIYIVDNAGDIVSEASAAGTDTVQCSVSYALTANVENLFLIGTGNINATGNDLVNTITGNAGNNTIDGGAGADNLAGGAGDDTYLVDNTSDTVTESSGAGTDTIQSSVTYSLDTNLEDLVLTGLRNINGTGNDLANTIIGNAGDNTIDGGAGTDNMAGGGGDDIYLVDSIRDVVTEAASEGIDTVQSSVSYALNANVENLVLTGTGYINATGNDLANTINGNTGDNTIDGSAGTDNMAGDAGNDIYVVDDAGDIVTEATSEGIDTVQSSIYYALTANVENLILTGAGNINGTGNDLANTINGNAGNNTIDGGAGADNMAGDTGNDIYVVDNAGDVVTEAALEGIDTVQSSLAYSLVINVENLVLTGTGNISGTGNDLANTINGNAGNNTIDGGAGADNMAGDAGNDIYVVDNAGDVVTEVASEGIDTVQSSVTYSLSINVENLILTGTDDINGTGNALNNLLTGNSGGNILSGGAGDDIYLVDNASDVVSEAASEGIDTVQSSVTFTLAKNVENLLLTGTDDINGTGNDLANTINGNTGNNTIDGGAGTDNMAGGAGDDIYVVDDSGDVVTEASGAGIDTVQSSISYAITTNIENLTLTGTGNINGTGNALNNLLTGNSGANILSGGAGDDTYLVDNATDVVSEAASEGIDTVQSSVSYSLATNVENLVLTGEGNINATGNDLANTINGNTGNNTIDGGAGADNLAGGVGDDNYLVDDISDVVTEAASEGTDTVQSSISYALAANVENLVLIGTGNINGIGNTLNNILTGNSGSNILRGGAGYDTYKIGNGDTVIENPDAGTDDTVHSSASYTLFTTNVENLMLTGTSAINGTGNALHNHITGNSAANIITGGAGADTLAGQAGADTFRYTALSNSQLAGYDRIEDLDIDSDTIDGPRAVSAENINELGTVVTLDQAGISAVLTTMLFGANQAATFTLGSGNSTRTFLALNDATAGFSSTSDCLIEITGYTGELTKLVIS